MIDDKIKKFFRKHHVLTIATTIGNEPWCANCFYVYLEDENALVFTSDITTRHSKEFIKKPSCCRICSSRNSNYWKNKRYSIPGGLFSEPEGDLLGKSKKRIPQAIPRCCFDGYTSLDSTPYLY